MNSREKLNAAHFYVSLLIGAIAGAVCQSWVAFIVVTCGAIVACLHDGRIRPKPTHRP